MLGVASEAAFLDMASEAAFLDMASEAAFLDMAQAFAEWLKDDEQLKFRGILDKPRNTYFFKFTEFRKRIEGYKGDLPPDLGDNMALTLDSVSDLLRIYRNESGHPTGKMMQREDAFVSLQLFITYLQKLCALRNFFSGDMLQ